MEILRTVAGCANGKCVGGRGKGQETRAEISGTCHYVYDLRTPNGFFPRISQSGPGVESPMATFS